MWPGIAIKKTARNSRPILITKLRLKPTSRAPRIRIHAGRLVGLRRNFGVKDSSRPHHTQGDPYLISRAERVSFR
jgi:hypothetical protein